LALGLLTLTSLAHVSPNHRAVVGFLKKTPQQPWPIPSHSSQILGLDSLLSQKGHLRLLKNRGFLNRQNLVAVKVFMRPEASKLAISTLMKA